MKKVIIVLIICALVVTGVWIIVGNQEIKDEILKIIPLNGKELEEYSNEFEINRLKTKNQTFYYNTLNDKCKKIYTAIANATRDLNKEAKLEGYEYIDNQTALKDVEMTMNAFFADHPEVFYIDSQYTIVNSKALFQDVVTVNLTYLVASKNELEGQIVKIEKSINEITNGLMFKDPFEVELYLHDEIAKNVQYYNYANIDDVPQECHNIYGVFINKKAVCDGFTKAMQILLDKNNIDNMCVLGALESQAHAWNLVKLNNNWYHLDLTSNKSIKEERNNQPIILHSYFNITTEKALKTHTIENVEILPESKSEEYNYYRYTGKYISNTDNFNSKLIKLLESNKNENLLEFETDNIANVPEKIVNALSKNRYNDYINSNKITYYNIQESYAIIKNK